MQVERDVEMRARDGVILRADIFRPARGDGPFPAILVRTPYDKRGNETDPYLGFAQIVDAGFIIVSQDVRGRHASGEVKFHGGERQTGGSENILLLQRRILRIVKSARCDPDKFLCTMSSLWPS